MNITFCPKTGLTFPDSVLEENILNLIEKGLPFTIGSELAVTVIRLLVVEGKIKPVTLEYIDGDNKHIIEIDETGEPNSSWPMSFCSFNQSKMRALMYARLQPFYKSIQNV